MFTIDQSKSIPDPATDDLIPEISISIKLGASDRPSTLPAATQFEIRKYTIVGNDPIDEVLLELIVDSLQFKINADSQSTPQNLPRVAAL